MCTRTIATTAALGFFSFLVALVVWTLVATSHLKDDDRPMRPAYADVTVVDVAHGVDAGTLASLVRLRADERVVAVDDQQVINDFAVGAAIAARVPGSGKYIDLTVRGATGSRRVLVLMH